MKEQPPSSNRIAGLSIGIDRSVSGIVIPVDPLSVIEESSRGISSMELQQDSFVDPPGSGLSISGDDGLGAKPSSAASKSQCFRMKIGISENARKRCVLIIELLMSESR